MCEWHILITYVCLFVYFLLRMYVWWTKLNNSSYWCVYTCIFVRYAFSTMQKLTEFPGDILIFLLLFEITFLSFIVHIVSWAVHQPAFTCPSWWERSTPVWRVVHWAKLWFRDIHQEDDPHSEDDMLGRGSLSRLEGHLQVKIRYYWV